MNIGIVHPELIFPRGAEKQVCKLSHYLTKMGHEVTIYTFEKKKSYIFDSLLEDIEIISLNTAYRISNIDLNNFRWYYLIWKLSKKIKKHDVINTHNHPTQWISKFMRIPTVWMCNEPVIWNYYSWRGYKKIRIYPYYLLDKYLTANIRLIAALDSRMKKIVDNSYKNSRIEVTGSGASLDKKIYHEDNDFFDILYIGAMHPQKRPLDILESVFYVKNRIRNIRIHYVGNGILKKKCMNFCKKYNIKTNFYEFVNENNLYKLYSIADLSVYVPENQPWGIFPLESILAKIPTIISDQCGIIDILPIDKFPIVQTGNLTQISSQIIQIYENYQQFKKITSEVSSMIEKNYSWERYTERMLDLYKKLIIGEI